LSRYTATTDADLREMLAAIGVGVAILGVFAWIERRPGKTGLIESSLLRNRAYLAGIAVVVAFCASFVGLMLVVSLFVQLGLHFSPIHAGLTIAPMALGVTVTAGASYPLMARYGRKVLQSGLVVAIVSLPVLAAMVGQAGMSSTTWTIAPGAFALGLGLGLVFGLKHATEVSGVEDHEVGSASGVLNALQQFCTANRCPVIIGNTLAYVDAGHLTLEYSRVLAPALEALADRALAQN